MSAKKQKENRAEQNFAQIGEALTSTEQFLEKNQKPLLIGLLVMILLVGSYLAYHYLYKLPRNEKAQAALYKGERYFQEGQDSLALFGNGNDYLGFETIISRFKGTRSADLARAYAGIAYNRMGDNDKALSHLKKFKGGDLLITPAITGTIGDVYMDMGDTDKAISQFIGAAKKANDTMLSPMFYKKAGNAYLLQGNYEKAIEIFTLIKDKYLNTPEGREADKYITQAQLLKESK